MIDYQKYINALRKCAKEHENDRTSTGHIIVYDLCRDTANLLEELEQEPKWISVNDKLPNDRNWYLGIFKEPDTGWINPLPFICDYVGRETKATTKEYWILRGFTDRDERIDYYFNLECVEWMPLPESLKAESDG